MMVTEKEWRSWPRSGGDWSQRRPPAAVRWKRVVELMKAINDCEECSAYVEEPCYNCAENLENVWRLTSGGGEDPVYVSDLTGHCDDELWDCRP
ncbi:MAG: hypothetical protein EHM78_19385 [Myxococcaceae bacterium]|nr:MAG: hypothetical protein EHM78_19385 [Myxococcaceae bacterium]